MLFRWTMWSGAPVTAAAAGLEERFHARPRLALAERADVDEDGPLEGRRDRNVSTTSQRVAAGVLDAHADAQRTALESAPHARQDIGELRRRRHDPPAVSAREQRPSVAETAMRDGTCPLLTRS
jgi:hypothetical protein